MSAEVIPFPSWGEGKQTIDSEEEMVAYMIQIQARGPDAYRTPKEAAEFGRLAWREFQRRGMVGHE